MYCNIWFTMARLVLLRAPRRDRRRGGRNRIPSAYRRTCPRCSRQFNGRPVMNKKIPLTFSDTSFDFRRCTYQQFEDRPIGSLCTLIFRRLASYGLRRLPGIVQREAQKALEDGSFRGIALGKPSANLNQIANHFWRVAAGRVYKQIFDKRKVIAG